MASEFRTALTACCLLCKADIPEVEAVKRLLEPLIRDRWEEIAILVLVELRRRLALLPAEFPLTRRGIAGRERELELLIRDIVDSLTADIQRAFDLPFDAVTRDAVDEAVLALLGAGGTFSGDLDLSSAQLPIQADVSAQELSVMLSGLLSTQMDSIREILTEALSDQVARAIPNALGAPTVTDQLLARALTPSRGLAATIDAWAYGVFNAGVFAAASLDGVIGYRLLTVPDGRRTKFCGYISGRTVPISRVQKQIAAARTAVLRRDLSGLIAAKPFLDSKTAQHGSALEFETFFRRAGLPGYHFGCRTVPKPIKAEDDQS